MPNHLLCPAGPGVTSDVVQQFGPDLTADIVQVGRTTANRASGQPSNPATQQTFGQQHGGCDVMPWDHRSPHELAF
jgi:hypothetical protein